MRAPRKARAGSPESRSLGPRFWAIINDRTPNPFVEQRGSRRILTPKGLEHLERTETVRVVEWVGLEKRERVLTRKEWTDRWAKQVKEKNGW